MAGPFLRDPTLADIPVLVLSACGEQFTQGDRLGIEVVLQKPVSPRAPALAAKVVLGGICPARASGYTAC